MVDPRKIKGFEWDTGNMHKSYAKHRVSPNEAEEIFADDDFFWIRDEKHSQDEDRFAGFGKTKQGRKLYTIFTIRTKNIRIISSRPMSSKERIAYEKAQTSS